MIMMVLNRYVERSSAVYAQVLNVQRLYTKIQERNVEYSDDIITIINIVIKCYFHFLVWKPYVCAFVYCI